jgi:hypothetical protein
MDDELAEYQDPDNWIDDEDSIHEPIPSPGAVVSVHYSREEFRTIARVARAAGMMTTEFVGTAALSRANEALSSGSVEAASVSGSKAKSGYAGNQGKSPKTSPSVRSRIGQLLSGH